MGEFIPVTSVTSGIGEMVTPDIYCYSVQIVNICFVGDPKQTNGWALVDTGMPRSADKIIHAAEEHFGAGTRPEAIILTHGHFDHVGAVVELTETWKVPVYAHELEMPYLTGQSDYPPADPSVDSGLVAKMSPFFPRHSIDLGSRVQKLPMDGSIPEMPGWRWIHTPGHTPGHVSLFRDADGILIAGDAITTTEQESLYKVITQKQELHGPPAYFTTDWQASFESVKRLAALKPSAMVSGHGVPMSGESLIQGLEALVENFERTEIPKEGRYVK
ncbi:putative metallo-hydrolase YflN [compost metagenome]